jgi:hypothetical protein
MYSMFKSFVTISLLAILASCAAPNMPGSGEAANRGMYSREIQVLPSQTAGRERQTNVADLSSRRSSLRQGRLSQIARADMTITSISNPFEIPELPPRDHKAAGINELQRVYLDPGPGQLVFVGTYDSALNRAKAKLADFSVDFPEGILQERLDTLTDPAERVKVIHALKMVQHLKEAYRLNDFSAWAAHEDYSRDVLAQIHEREISLGLNPGETREPCP